VFVWGFFGGGGWRGGGGVGVGWGVVLGLVVVGGCWGVFFSKENFFF